jgi:hypothetical protein
MGVQLVKSCIYFHFRSPTQFAKVSRASAAKAGEKYNSHRSAESAAPPKISTFSKPTISTLCKAYKAMQ